MTKKEKEVLASGLRKVSKDIAEIALYLEGSEAQTKEPAAQAPEQTETPARTEPAKTATYEEARAVLAEKSRTGFRAEVKSILTAHGLKQLSDAKGPEEFAAIVAEAEAIGNA